MYPYALSKSSWSWILYLTYNMYRSSLRTIRSPAEVDCQSGNLTIRTISSKWVARARYLSDEQCEDPDYAVNKGEKYYYFYGINHEQLDANFGDKLAVEKKYDVLKFDKVALAFWN